MKLTLLGTGTPEPSLVRQSSGYIVEIGSDRLVFDGGPGSYHRFLEAGYQPTDTTHVFFTHYHYDHCIEYPRMVLQRWDMGAGKVPDLEVFGPAPLTKITDQLFGEDGVFSHDLRARTENPSSLFVYQQRGGVLPRVKPKPRVREVKPGDVISGNGWTVRVGEGRHFQPQLECYGYRIDTKAGSLCYAGDSGAECASMIELAQGADVLVHMLQMETGTEPPGDFRFCNGTHLDVARLAAAAQVRTLVATHIGHRIDQPGTRERLIAEMTREFSGVIIWGADLMTIPIGVG
jgi:ribonuclease Z